MKRVAVVALSVCSLAGLFAAPAANADPSGCITVHLNVNGQDLVNQTQCLPPAS